MVLKKLNLFLLSLFIFFAGAFLYKVLIRDLISISGWNLEKTQKIEIVMNENTFMQFPIFNKEMAFEKNEGKFVYTLNKREQNALYSILDSATKRLRQSKGLGLYKIKIQQDSSELLILSGGEHWIRLSGGKHTYNLKTTINTIIEQ
jgi:hypothetical protein